MPAALPYPITTWLPYPAQPEPGPYAWYRLLVGFARRPAQRWPVCRWASSPADAVRGYQRLLFGGADTIYSATLVSTYQLY